MSVRPRDVTPAKYTEGSIKQDPVTLAVAVRTHLPDVGTQENDWGVVTVTHGGWRAGYIDVQYWPDLYIAP
jgi:hypothetical protein